MSKKALLLKRLDEIGVSLSQCEGAQALLGLGSVGLEQDRIDDYSDLDFFVICEAGYKARFIEDVDWLESCFPISFIHKNTVDGYKLLFADGVFCECAIFETEELKAIKFTDPRIVWHANEFDVSLCEPQCAPVIQTVDVAYEVNETLTNLYVGMCRYNRGGKLSAYRFIGQYAKDRVLHLISVLETPENISRDSFSIIRRFEFRYPMFVDMLPQIVVDYNHIPQAAETILEFLSAHFTVNQAMKEEILKLCRATK